MRRHACAYRPLSRWACCAPAGIGGYSPSLLAWLFVGAVAAGVISAPRDATGGAPSPSLGVPLPWDYDAEAVAAYWAQR
jgi:hypothetical protein